MLLPECAIPASVTSATALHLHSGRWFWFAFPFSPHSQNQPHCTLQRHQQTGRHHLRYCMVPSSAKLLSQAQILSTSFVPSAVTRTQSFFFAFSILQFFISFSIKITAVISVFLTVLQALNVNMLLLVYDFSDSFFFLLCENWGKKRHLTSKYLKRKKKKS